MPATPVEPLHVLPAAAVITVTEVAERAPASPVRDESLLDPEVLAAVGVGVLDTPAALLAMAPTASLAPSMAPALPNAHDRSGAASPSISRPRSGAVVHVSGLPASSAREDVLALTKGVACRLALLQLAPNGRPSGAAYVCVARMRDAQRFLGAHQSAGARQLNVSQATPADVRGNTHGFLCVLGGKDDDAATQLGLVSPHRKGTGDASLLGLAATMHDGVRVTGSMAAAALEELLGFGAQQERFADERFEGDT